MKLNKRVEADLKALQDKSELLVAMVQLIVIALLAFIFFLAPVERAADSPVNSEALGIGLFAILVMVRLWFAYTQQLTRLFLGFSVIAEMSVLILTIWSFHLQFGAIPAVDLKNPHLMYVFVLIALRGLRFEPIWVVLSGLTAAIGWGLLVLNALYVSGHEIMTWDYVTYVSTSNVHLGGEFDKILAILLVTIITAYTLKIGRAVTSTAVSQSHATQDLSKFFDSDVAKKITDAEYSLDVGEGEMRNAAIMFTDLRGFTKASATLTPDELIALLGEYQQLVGPIVREHGGTIDKFMGDGILASFGSTSPSATYAADAMRAADAIMDAASAWGDRRTAAGLERLDIGAGVTAGALVFGVIGFENRLEYTVIGETVNLAAKLEKFNKAEKVRALTTLATLDLAKAQGYQAKSEKEIRLKREVSGVELPIDLVVIA